MALLKGNYKEETTWMGETSGSVTATTMVNMHNIL